MLRKFLHKGMVEAGCDEAGRGCLAGPVFAAAVILPPTFRRNRINDSKLLDEKERTRLRAYIEKHTVWAVGVVDQQEIDEINILNASFLAMHRAIDGLSQIPEHLLIDGNRFKPYREIPFDCVIKGDSKFLAIAAASILAKTHRDEYMSNLARTYPQYSWDTNMGYPTPAHRNAIREFGLTPIHRRSFRQLPDQLEIFD